MDTRATKSKRATAAKPWHQIAGEHVGEWILMEVTGQDAQGRDTGCLLATSPDPDPLHVQMRQLLRQKKGQFSVFRGTRLLDSGPELEEAAQKLVSDLNERLAAARRAGQ